MWREGHRKAQHIGLARPHFPSRITPPKVKPEQIVLYHNCALEAVTTTNWHWQYTYGLLSGQQIYWKWMPMHQIPSGSITLSFHPAAVYRQKESTFLLSRSKCNRPYMACSGRKQCGMSYHGTDVRLLQAATVTHWLLHLLQYFKPLSIMPSSTEFSHQQPQAKCASASQRGLGHWGQLQTWTCKLRSDSPLPRQVTATEENSTPSRTQKGETASFDHSLLLIENLCKILPLQMNS